MLVLQKLEEALVHTGDIALNICFFKVGKRCLYSCHGFLRGGHVAQAAMCLATGSTAQVQFQVSEGVEIFFSP